MPSQQSAVQCFTFSQSWLAGWLAAWLPDVSHSGGSMISARGNLDALAGNKTLGRRGETAAAVNVLVELR